MCISCSNLCFKINTSLEEAMCSDLQKRNTMDSQENGSSTRRWSLTSFLPRTCLSLSGQRWPPVLLPRVWAYWDLLGPGDHGGEHTAGPGQGLGSPRRAPTSKWEPDDRLKKLRPEH